MRIVKALVIAFSMYSQIPMPQFEWKDEDMKYMMIFFPFVGAVIGGILYLWYVLCVRFGIGDLCRTCIGVAIPLVLTGGIHVDGFMDTSDAFHSYQSKEKKLEILKDAHIGAFAVIMLATVGLLYVGAFSQVNDASIFAVLCAGFFLARALSGIGVVTFKSAKKDGLLFMFASNAQKVIVRSVLVLEVILCVAFMLMNSLLFGGSIAATAFLVFGYYYLRTKKELGGITGDTAGYFVVLCECAMAIAAAVICVVK